MINLLLGPPGGGKSYEAVVFHILPALANGRLVITNLPLDLDYIFSLFPEYRGLIELRKETLAEKPEIDWKKAEELHKRFGIAAKQKYWINAPFAHAADYGHAWRHPVSGAGPLYVIDECHIPLPINGTEMEVEHWFSLHRHESADVLLITQSYGKINRAIRDLVQVCYRVKKATAFGSQGSYIRKVQDGLRGEVVNTTVRQYEKQYFPFYKSHTRGGGSELAANDIVPIWKRWPFIGAALCFTTLVCMFLFLDMKNPLDARQVVGNKISAFKTVQTQTQTLAPAQVAELANQRRENFKPVPSSSPAPVSVPKDGKPKDPLSDKGIHIVGHLVGAKKEIWIFALSQNGQKLQNLYDRDLREIGYKIEPLDDCGAWLTYQKDRRFVTCDSPQVSVRPQGLS